MTSRHAQWDALTPAALQERGSMKWTGFPGALGAWVAEMDFGTSPAVLAMLEQVVRRQDFGYLHPAAQEAVKDATAAFVAQRYGWPIDVGAVHVIPDVIEGVKLAIAEFSPPGSPIILPSPAYMPFFEVPGMVKRDLVEVPMAADHGRYSFDLDALDRALGGGGTLILCNPYNPLGRVFTADELHAVARVVEANGARVVADEIHAPLVYQGYAHVPYASLSTAAAGHTITVLSPSKGWNLPGLKSAQLVTSNDRDAEIMAGLGMWPSHGASTPGVWASVAAYRDDTDWFDDVLAYLDGNRQYLADLLAGELPQVRYRPPEGTYLAWLDVRELGLGSGDVAQRLRTTAGIAVVDGAACHGQGFLRVNFGTGRGVLDQVVAGLARAANAA